MAACTAPTSACTRISMLGLGEPSGTITRQPSSLVQFCHCTGSAASSRATAGALDGCAASGQSSRLIVAQASANPFGQFFNVIRFLDGRHGDHVAVVLLQIDFQLIGEIRQLGGVLQILLMLGSCNFVAL